jgi:photosystem II stability/assembly factor-like uncharacterized protein
MTTDGGKNWKNVTPAGLQECMINSIELSPMIKRPLTSVPPGISSMIMHRTHTRQLTMAKHGQRSQQELMPMILFV